MTFEENIDTFPPGTIIMWNGQEESFPPGFVYCDGNNGTPDLRNSFLKSIANEGDDAGFTGGADSINLSASQMPNHSHSGSIESSGSHNHNIGGGTGSDQAYAEAYTNHTDNWDYSVETDIKGEHSHSLDNNSSGSSSAIENRPEFKTLHILMKA
jgi:microcystin-dependent protein